MTLTRKVLIGVAALIALAVVLISVYVTAEILQSIPPDIDER